MTMIPFVPLKVLIVDTEQPAAQALQTILKQIDPAPITYVFNSIDLAKSAIKEHDINTIYIDPISVGMDIATNFIFDIRKLYPNIVFVLYYNSEQQMASVPSFFEGVRRQFSRFYKLDKSISSSEFPAKVASTVYECQEYILGRQVLDTLKHLKSDIAHSTPPKESLGTVTGATALVEKFEQFLMVKKRRAYAEIGRIQNAEFLGPSVPQKLELNVFVVMPYSKSWSQPVEDEIREICKSVKFEMQIAKNMKDRFIPHDIWKGVNEATVVIADLTGANANVSYEVGLADAIGREVILISQEKSVPFDFLAQRLILYENTVRGIRTLREQLFERLDVIRKKLE